MARKPEFREWTASELFDYLQGLKLIDEDEKFEDWKHDRVEMIDLAEDSLL